MKPLWLHGWWLALCLAWVCPASAQPASPGIEAWTSLRPWVAEPGLAAQAATWAWRAIHEAPAPEMPQQPAALWQPRPHLVIVHFSDGVTRAGMALGHGDNLAAALRSAVGNALRKGAGDSTRWVTVELVQTVLPARTLALLSLADFEHGLDGLVFDLDEPLVLSPAQIVAWDLVTRGGRMDLEALQQGLGLHDPRASTLLRRWRAGGLRVWSFTTAAAFAGTTGVATLYRGHRTDHDLSPAGLTRAAAAGGAYLARSVDDTGQFVYHYRPSLIKPDPSNNEAYNIVRHNGTIYAMMEMYERAPDASLLAAAKRALDHLRKSVQPTRINNTDALCVVEGNEVKLGGNALAILAMAKHAQATSHRGDYDTMRGLAAWILATQAPSGEFQIHKKIWPEGEATPFESGYYPGEAIFALMRLYTLTRDERYHDAARRGAEFLITQRDRGLAIDQLMHDHWLLYGLNELCAVKDEPLLSLHARRLVQAIIDAQHRQPPYPDWIGGFYDPPRVTPTATRAEGLLAAWRLFNRQGDAGMIAAIVASVTAATQFQLHLQVGPELAMHLPEPARALGGFRDSYDDIDIRIDYVQHSISALLAAADMQATAPPSSAGSKPK
jgi:hypothetical protein